MGTMINTYLETHTIFPWYSGENGLFRGYVYDQNDNYLINEEAWKYINEQLNQKQCLINGAFIFVRLDANECTIVADLGGQPAHQPGGAPAAGGHAERGGGQ